MRFGGILAKPSALLHRAQRWLRRRFGQEYRLEEQRPLQRLGSPYGGWTIDPTGIDQNSIVYSCGVGDDISFDLSLIDTFGCTVYAFDPTPKSIVWIEKQELPEEFRFFSYGIAAYDGLARFGPPLDPAHVSYSMLRQSEEAGNILEAPVYRLQSIMKRFGHSKLDLLKLDIEGTEYDVLAQIEPLGMAIDQILVEFHHRFAEIRWRQTQAAIKSIKRQGFRTAYVSRSGDEFTFVKRST